MVETCTRLKLEISATPHRSVESNHGFVGLGLSARGRGLVGAGRSAFVLISGDVVPFRPNPTKDLSHAKRFSFSRCPAYCHLHTGAISIIRLEVHTGAISIIRLEARGSLSQNLVVHQKSITSSIVMSTCKLR